MILFFIGLICLSVVALIFHLKEKVVLNHFNDGNVIVFGKKGKGKDLVFQRSINKSKHKVYSNISYGKNSEPASYNMLELGNNTYENFIKGNIEKLDISNYPYENCDFYFSDAGIALPSQYDSYLHKTYKSLPIAYALSRHLWNNNIHVNTQALDRVWKALREQADFYIRCDNTIKIFGLYCTKVTTYDNYHAALAGLNPLKSTLFNKYSKAETDKYIATNGHIDTCWIFNLKHQLHYDTRAFKSVVFKD